MTPITVNQLIELLQGIVAQDKQNGNLPCYTYPEGGQDILEDWEVRIKMSSIYKPDNRKLPKRLQIG